MRKKRNPRGTKLLFPAGFSIKKKEGGNKQSETAWWSIQDIFQAVSFGQFIALSQTPAPHPRRPSSSKVPNEPN